MTKKNFEEILNIVENSITPNSTHSPPIGDALRYLASGNSQISLAISYRISPSSVSLILREVLNLICALMGPLYLPSPTEDIWIENEVGFNTKWNYPNACGAVDGKHIRIIAPKFSGSTSFNHKGYFVNRAHGRSQCGLQIYLCGHWVIRKLIRRRCICKIKSRSKVEKWNIRASSTKGCG